jgi:hypothetical protein
MSYLFMLGQVRGVTLQPAGKDKRTGEVIPERHKVQVEVEEVTPLGEIRYVIHTLTTDRPEAFTKAIGRKVKVPVGVFAAEGRVQFFLPKARGALPVDPQVEPAP